MLYRLAIPRTTINTRTLLRLCLIGLLLLLIHNATSGFSDRLPRFVYTFKGTSPVNFQFEAVFGLGDARDSCFEDKSHLGVKYLVNGPPARSFRSNLRNDRHYLTAWANAGLTNEFMGIVNMIYLAMLSDRVPIIPPFSSENHTSRKAGYVAFGDIFDLERYRNEVGQAVLEWRDVKQPSIPYEPAPFNRKRARHQRFYEELEATSDFIDTLGCWSTRANIHPDVIPAHTFIPGWEPSLMKLLNLDVSYTQVPPETRSVHDRNRLHVTFPGMAGLLFPPAENPKNLRDVEAYQWQSAVRPKTADLILSSPRGKQVAPDEHLACLDIAYFMTSGPQDFEWGDAWAPAWRFVGKHLRFRQGIEEVAKGYLRRALNLSAEDGDDIPPFITVHIRRGDFVCHGQGACDITSMDLYRLIVRQVQEELRERNGVDVDKVILTSDETDDAFWDEVRGMGWYSVDHSLQGEDTFARYGEWYLPIIDVVIQSMAKGFVGSPGSTFSLISGRRVVEWNDGVRKTAFPEAAE
uniref:Uncharacterized protein n=1 Tax=Moniliophthora roreri TaxID=221103 RepID=A0A0W0FVA7_MONRR